MKFKNILGAGLVIASMAVGSCNVFAANQTSFTFGTPIDAETGSAVDGEISAGSVIALPVDVVSGEEKSIGFVASLSYDEDYLTAGVADSELSDAQYNNLIALSNNDDTAIQRDSAGTTDYVIKNVYTTARGNKKTVQGAYTVVNKAAGESNRINFSWVAGSLDGYAFSATEPELYVLFKVNKDVTADDLNVDFFTVNGAGTDTYVDAINTVPETTVEKVNSTQGAFKVVLDADALPAGNWVQGLYAQVGSTKQEITACVHADGTTTYEFPVRVNSATGATDSIDVDIYATTTADEAGATTSTDKKVGSINLTMDGTVTSYNTVNATLAE